MSFLRLSGLSLSAILALTTTASAFETLTFNVAGGDDDLEADLRNASLIQQAKAEDLIDPAEILASARSDYARLVGVLYASGRFGGVVTIQIDGREAASIQPLNAPASINQITVSVVPGPIYRFSETRVTPLAAGTELPEAFGIGQPAETPVIQDTAAAATTAWQKIGHAKASIDDQEIVIRHDDEAVDVRLTVAPGPRVRFGTVGVTGNKDVRTARILKIAGLEEGRVYDPDEIEAAARRLRQTGTFRSVVVNEAEEVAAGDTLPLEIAVVEQTPRRFGVGAEISTVEGLRLSGFWLHRNWLGGAERLRVEGEIAGIGGQTGGTDYRFSTRYERPATPRADTDLFVLGEIERLDEPEFESDTLSLSVGFKRRATDELNVEFGVGYVFSDVTDDFGSETYEYLTLPLRAIYDRRDNALNPKSGYFADLKLTPFYGLSGTSEGAQLEFDGRYYQTVASDRVTLAGRLQLGALAGPDLLETPPTFRFFSGGGGTVRGQDYQSLGVDIGADTTGGRSFVGLSGEARVNIGESFQGVAFYDWGYIGEESFYDGSGDSHAGAGIGLRYVTGIGPIRLDIATPVSGDTPASDFYIYVGIGQAF